MKELQVPFDSAWILKNRRKIKKALLADGTPRMEKKIAVLGGSTTNDIVSMLELFLLDNGIQPSFYQSEYARYWQDAMFENPEPGSLSAGLDFHSHHQPQHHRISGGCVLSGGNRRGSLGTAVYTLYPDVGSSGGRISLPNYSEQL